MKILEFINRPEVKLILASAAAGAGVTMACKATLSLDRAVDEYEAKISDVKQNYISTLPNGDTVIEDRKEYRKVLTKTHISFWSAVGRMYGPSAALFALSWILFGSIYKDISDLKAENLELAAGWKASEAILNRYRQDKREQIGEEAEQRFFSGIETKDIEVVETDESGKEKKRKIKGAEVVNGELHGHAFIFDSSCWSFVGRDEGLDHNLYIAQLIQDQCSDNLYAHGSITLNEIHDAFGKDRVDYGFRLGCIPKSKGGKSDKVDLGIRTVWVYDRAVDDYVERILIDPHLDGIIDVLI